MSKKRISLYYIAQEYLKSSWFKEKSVNTQTQYEYYINMYDGRKLAVLASEFKAVDADNMYQYIKNTKGLRSAEYFVSVWKVVFRYAELNGHVDRNPWTVVRLKGSKPRRQRWTRDQVEAIIKEALSRRDVTLAAFVQLLYDTAQRPSDILTIDLWYKVNNQWYIDLTQNKTGSEVIVPISDTAMDLCGRPEPASRKFLLSFDIKTLNALRRSFNNIKDFLNIPKELQLRDIRRTAITEMSERGATDDEMRTVSGHKDSSMLPVYSVPTILKAQAMFDRRFKE